MAEMRLATEADGAAIAEIYNYYVINSTATFEVEPVSSSAMAGRITQVLAGYPWFVAEEDSHVVGYSYATTWKPRAAYGRTVEASVYMRHGAAGRGFGSRLYGRLLSDLRDRGVHAVLAGVGLPNAASVRLHEKHGFTKVGELKEVGFKLNRWVSVAYWEKIL